MNVLQSRELEAYQMALVDLGNQALVLLMRQELEIPLGIVSQGVHVGLGSCINQHF